MVSLRVNIVACGLFGAAAFLVAVVEGVAAATGALFFLPNQFMLLSLGSVLRNRWRSPVYKAIYWFSRIYKENELYLPARIYPTSGMKEMRYEIGWDEMRWDVTFFARRQTCQILCCKIELLLNCSVQSGLILSWQTISQLGYGVLSGYGNDVWAVGRMNCTLTKITFM